MPSPILSGEKKNLKCEQAPTHNEVQVEFNVIPGRTLRINAVRLAHSYGLLVTNQTWDILKILYFLNVSTRFSAVAETLFNRHEQSS